jgi:hypothetical protein
VFTSSIYFLTDRLYTSTDTRGTSRKELSIQGLHRHLLSTRESEKVLRESQLFIKDNPGFDDPDVKYGMNTGLYMRSRYTNKGEIVEMEGPIHIDIFQQNRLMVNGVGLALSKDVFRLISNEDDASYKVQILDVSFNLCLQKPKFTRP